MAEYTNEISITIDSLVTKVKQHLAVIGKRAVDTQGKGMFSNITLSTSEDKKMLTGLFDVASSNIVSNLTPIVSDYSASSTNIKFYIVLTREKDENRTAVDARENKMDIVKAATDSIEKYIYNYALAEYLSMIYPAIGNQHPPMYGGHFYARCENIMADIVKILYDKRPSKFSEKSYKDIKGEVINE